MDIQQLKTLIGKIIGASFIIAIAALGSCNLSVVQHLNNPYDPQSPYYRGPPTPAPSDYVSPIVGTLRYVPAGKFQRDSNKDDISSQSAFHIGTTEITRGQFSAIMGNDPSDETVSSDYNYPVQNVSWYQAILFCNKLSAKEGLTPVYSIAGKSDIKEWTALPSASPDQNWSNVAVNWSADGYRLPTASEWFWAAMGAIKDAGATWSGTVNASGYGKAFSGSVASPMPSAIGNYAWYYGNSDGIAHSSGSKIANELSIYDMSGNVAEWVWDWYQNTMSGPVSDYHGPVDGEERVYFGGDFSSSSLSISIVNKFSPEKNNPGLGFRVVRN